MWSYLPINSKKYSKIAHGSTTPNSGLCLNSNSQKNQESPYLNLQTKTSTYFLRKKLERNFKNYRKPSKSQPTWLLRKKCRKIKIEDIIRVKKNLSDRRNTLQAKKKSKFKVIKATRRRRWKWIFFDLYRRKRGSRVLTTATQISRNNLGERIAQIKRNKRRVLRSINFLCSLCRR